MSILPTEPTQPKKDASDSSILAFGDAKLGKTEFAAEFPDSVILATENGQNFLTCYRVPIDSWQTFLTACGELARGDHGFRTITIDTVDNLWMLCQRYICERHKVEHESDLAYGKGYGLIYNEFQRVLTRLSQIGLGLLLIGHADREVVEGRTGRYERAVPALKDRVRKFLLGMCDLVLYCDQEAVAGPDGKTTLRRVLRTKPSPYWVAGDRTGRLPETIDFSYPAFAAAFEAAVKQDPSPAEESSVKQGA